MRSGLLAVMFAWLRGTRGLVINAPSALGKKSTAADVIATIKPDLSGKVAIVTGGNSGIGVETVKALASAGAKSSWRVATSPLESRARHVPRATSTPRNWTIWRRSAFADRVATVDLLH